MNDVHLRLAEAGDCGALAQLLEALWPESTAEEHGRELASILGGDSLSSLPLVIFMAEASDGSLVGFVEVGMRSHADGCNSSHPVGYIEGWYVATDHRQRGIGAKLLSAAEDWARSQGCSEMASDALITNELSQLVHESLGFQVVDRCVHYRKPL